MIPCVGLRPRLAAGHANVHRPVVAKHSLRHGKYFDYSRIMETSSCVAALSALSHPGRLEVFRRLVRAGPEGLAAGAIARAVGARPSTLSSHLNVLSAAGLTVRRRVSRSIVYVAGYDRMRELLAFLVEDCCDGSPEICAPLAAVASRACDAEGRCV